MCSMKRDEMIDYGRKHSMEPTPWIECKKVLFDCFTILANVQKNASIWMQIAVLLVDLSAALGLS